MNHSNHQLNKGLGTFTVWLATLLLLALFLIDGLILYFPGENRIGYNRGVWGDLQFTIALALFLIASILTVITYRNWRRAPQTYTINPKAAAVCLILIAASLLFWVWRWALPGSILYHDFIYYFARRTIVLLIAHGALAAVALAICEETMFSRRRPPPSRS